MDQESHHPPNPRRVIAGRANRQKRGPLSEAGRERLRAAALANRPWLHSTGPRSEAGRAQAAKNGRSRQIGPLSVRQARAELAAVRALVRAIRATCSRLRV